jgi:hypothetical protein
MLLKGRVANEDRMALLVKGYRTRGDLPQLLFPRVGTDPMRNLCREQLHQLGRGGGEQRNDLIAPNK